MKKEKKKRPWFKIGDDGVKLDIRAADLQIFIDTEMMKELMSDYSEYLNKKIRSQQVRNYIEEQTKPLPKTLKKHEEEFWGK